MCTLLYSFRDDKVMEPAGYITVQKTLSSSVLKFPFLAYNSRKGKQVNSMGIYLNPGNAAFSEAVNSKIYVDKSELIIYTNSVAKFGS